MPNFVGKSDMNLGTDVSVSITSSRGQSYQAGELGHLMDIDVEAERQIVKLKPISNRGKTVRRTVYEGVKGKLTFARHSSVITDLLVQHDQDYLTKGSSPTYTIQVQILNRDNTLDTYLIPDCVLPGGKLLDAKSDQGINCDFPFEAPEMIKT